MRRTVIWFIVSVPVLSTQRTVAAPSVSMAGTRRVSTWRCESRQAPSARKIVRTTGNSSGSVAMASVIPASTPCSQSPRVRPYTTTTMTQRVAPRAARRRTSRLVSSSIAVSSVSSDRSAFPILPSSVPLPVARTRATPWPWTTSDPEKTNGRSSPPGLAGPASGGDREAGSAPGGGVRIARLRTGTDSPVSSDSSTVRLVVSTRTASAGTRSPSTSMTRSPQTTSRPGIRFRLPPRMTSARGLERSRSASRARSAFRCW